MFGKVWRRSTLGVSFFWHIKCIHIVFIIIWCTEYFACLILTRLMCTVHVCKCEHLLENNAWPHGPLYWRVSQHKLKPIISFGVFVLIIIACFKCVRFDQLQFISFGVVIIFYFSFLFLSFFLSRFFCRQPNRWNVDDLLVYRRKRPFPCQILIKIYSFQLLIWTYSFRLLLDWPFDSVYRKRFN